MSQHEDPAPTATPNAAAWLGQAGLYRTRLEAVRNFEQSIAPVSADELFNLASKQVLTQRSEARQSARLRNADTHSLEREGHA